MAKPKNNRLFSHLLAISLTLRMQYFKKPTMKQGLIILLLILTFNCSSLKQEESEPKKYLTEVLKIVEEHSINKDSVNFRKIKKSAFSKLSSTSSIEDCYPIVKSILKALGDNHSSFKTKAQINKWRSPIKPKDIKKLITFSGKRLNHNIGYIKMKGIVSGDASSIQKYADSLQQTIKSIDNKNLKGWILDLRENKGGNCWPMLAGIGPLLGNGICGYFVKANNNKTSWFYKDGESGTNDYTIAKLSKTPYKIYNTNAPIAILTGAKTASSGEVVVTAFHNKENAKSFGTNTAGLSTGNGSFRLSDGSVIFLTVSVYADRKGVKFGKEIAPDVRVEYDYNTIGTSNDRVIEKAMLWINSSD